MVNSAQFADWGFAADGLDEVFSVGAYCDPLTFATEKINLSGVVSARQDKFDITLTPYMAEPLAACDFRGHGATEITVVAVEQTGKSHLWQTALLWSFLHEPSLSLVVYPSEEKCDEINRSKLQPMMRGIPELASAMDAPRVKGKNRYNFPWCVSYFQGAGERISAHSARITVADEVSDWIEHDGDGGKLEDLRKRSRSFDDSLSIRVSSPKGETCLIWESYEKTSQGFWYLRCLGCGELTMRSSDIHNMDWEKRTMDSGAAYALPGTERLYCPICRHEHTEADKREMNINGGYIHKMPHLLERRRFGFQWGALASQFSGLAWGQIAEAQMAAGSSGEIKDQITFDNSFRGLCWTPRARLDATRENLKKRCKAAPEGEWDVILAAVDVQVDRAYYCVRGRIGSESYLIDHGQVGKLLDIEADIFARRYGKKRMELMVVDYGHRAKEVAAMVARSQGMIAYKGAAIVGRFKRSQSWEKLYIANAKLYQSELLAAVYSDVSSWHLPLDIDDEYLKHISSMKPNKSARTGRKGGQYANWVADGDDHFFDCEKMILVATDLYSLALRNSSASARASAVPEQ